MLEHYEDLLILSSIRDEKLKKVDKTKPLIDVCFGYGKKRTWSKMTEEEYEIMYDYYMELNRLDRLK